MPRGGVAPGTVSPPARCPRRSRGLWVRNARGVRPSTVSLLGGPSGAERPCSPELPAGLVAVPLSSRGSGVPVTTSLPFRHTPSGPGPAYITGWTSESAWSGLTCHSQTQSCLHPAPPRQLLLYSDHQKTTRREETHGGHRNPWPGASGLDLASSSETCNIYRSWRYCWC